MGIGLAGGGWNVRGRRKNGCEKEKMGTMRHWIRERAHASAFELRKRIGGNEEVKEKRQELCTECYMYT